MSYLQENWEVGVWSSATPENVERMLTFLGMKGVQGTNAKAALRLAAGALGKEAKGDEKKEKEQMKLKVVWARDTLGLSSSEYSKSKSSPFPSRPFLGPFFSCRLTPLPLPRGF